MASKPDNRVDIPLMPCLDWRQAVAIEKTVQPLEVGAEFKVLSQVEHKRMSLPWYKVLIVCGELAGQGGFINGAALLPKGRVMELEP